MFINKDARLILVLSLLSTARYVTFSFASENISDIRNRAVLLGYGYSTDSEQLTEEACFNATMAKITDQNTRIELTSSVSSSDLQKTFGGDISVQGSYGQFSTDAKAEYLRSIQEDEFSLSLNYYVISKEKVTVHMSGAYNDSLTDFGRLNYNDENLYKRFGLQCGDYYISSYDQGAVLFVGLNIVLASKEDKEELQGSFGTSYGSLTNVAAKIQSVSNEKKISGTVQIRGYQFGGDTSALTGIMSENIADCNIQDMSACNKVVSDLISYAKVFGNQIKNGNGLMALGSFNFVSIKRLGLKVPKSLVTPVVEQSRRDLEIKLKENRYYAKKLSPLAHDKYPVRLEDKLTTHIKSLYNRANYNIKLIMDPKIGAPQCFNKPEKCEKTKTKIYNYLKNITSNDLKFLKGMKYILPYKKNGNVYYNIGEDLNIWRSCSKRNQELCPRSMKDVEMEKFNVSQNDIEFFFSNDEISVCFDGYWCRFKHLYVGILTENCDSKYENKFNGYRQKLGLSPYFFEEYNSSIDIY